MDAVPIAAPSRRSGTIIGERHGRSPRLPPACNKTSVASGEGQGAVEEKLAVEVGFSASGGVKSQKPKKSVVTKSAFFGQFGHFGRFDAYSGTHSGTKEGEGDAVMPLAEINTV